MKLSLVRHALCTCGWTPSQSILIRGRLLCKTRDVWEWTGFARLNLLMGWVGIHYCHLVIQAQRKGVFVQFNVQFILTS